VVDENETVGFVGNISNLPPSSSFDVVFRREMNGARHDVSATISTNSSGVLTLNRTTTMARLGFYGGIYEGSNMLYNVLVTNNNDITLTTPVISVVIGTVLPDPVITWTSTATNFVVNPGDFITATGVVNNLLPNTEYTVYVRGQASGYSDFNLETSNRFTDATGSFTYSFNEQAPVITGDKLLNVSMNVFSLDTVNSVVPSKNLEYRVVNLSLATASWAIKPATPSSVSVGENIYFISTISDLSTGDDYLVTIQGRTSDNQTYGFFEEMITADENGQIVIDNSGIIDLYAQSGTLELYLFVQTDVSFRHILMTPDLIYTIV
jgi:hypothetical protein